MRGIICDPTSSALGGGGGEAPTTRVAYLWWIDMGILSSGGGVLFPWFATGNPGTGTEVTNGAILIPEPGTIDLLIAKNQNPSGSTDVTYTARRDGIAQSVTAVLNSGSSGLGEDLVNSFAVVRGNLVSVLYAQGSGGTLANRPAVVLRYTF